MDAATQTADHLPLPMCQLAVMLQVMKSRIRSKAKKKNAMQNSLAEK